MNTGTQDPSSFILTAKMQFRDATRRNYSIENSSSEIAPYSKPFYIVFFYKGVIGASNIPPSFPPRKSKHPYVVVSLVLVVAVVAVASGVMVIQQLTSVHLHVGVPADSAVNNLAGQQLIPNLDNSYSAYSGYGTALKETIAFFNTSNGEGFILIGSFEFANKSQSYGFYVNNPPNSMFFSKQFFPNATFENGSYDGFNFSSLTENQTGNYAFIAIGHSGSFAFWIDDSGIKLSSVTSLIHEEIQSME